MTLYSVISADKLYIEWYAYRRNIKQIRNLSKLLLNQSDYTLFTYLDKGYCSILKILNGIKGYLFSLKLNARKSNKRIDHESSKGIYFSLNQEKNESW